MRVLVVTIVHHPNDARIYFRQITALLAAGIEVAYAAPIESFETTEFDPRLELIDLPRAHGKRRFKAAWHAIKLLRTRSADFDLVIVHDPELLLAARFSKTKIVWDVHEDLAATINQKKWLPFLLRKPVMQFVRKLEQSAERKYYLLLAETKYQARFKKSHPVIPNTTLVKPVPNLQPTSSVIYLGNVTKLRGGFELIALAELLHQHGIMVEIIGSCAEPELSQALAAANQTGNLMWHGFIPNQTALAMLPGKLAGLSLLHDEPNYLVSQPTKIYEYLAASIPAISTPLPEAVKLIESAQAGFIVPFGDVKIAAEKILELANSAQLWQQLGQRGHAYVYAEHNWEIDQRKFILALEGFLAK